MKSKSEITSVQDKIAFFDNWVKSLIEVDPKEVRAKARKQTPLPPLEQTPLPPSEIKLEQPIPTKQTHQNPDDEDYGSEDEDEEIDHLSGLPEGDREMVMKAMQKPTKQTHQNPDEEDFGSEDEDEDEEFNLPSDLTEEERQTVMNAIKKQTLHDDSFDDDDSIDIRGEDDTKPVDTGKGPGLEGLALGEKYKGEEKGEGWQVGRNRDGRQIRTKYYSDNQKDESRVDFDDETGKADSNFETISGERGFVVDPKTGDVHQFTESGYVDGDEFVTTHHSSPLAGGDVAGAGKMHFKDGQLTNINDQSGHYKPGGKFTFQAVRAVNMATLSTELKEMLRKSASSSKDGGDAESPDTIQQLIAAEIQKKREVYFKELDEERQTLEHDARELEDEKDRNAAFEEMEKSYHEKANAFREIAREVEQDLLKDLPQNPLLDTSVGNKARHTDSTLPPKVRELAESQHALRSMIEEMLHGDKDADVSDLRKKDEKLTAMLRKLGYNDEKNKETKVALLGKSGMLSDDEYKSHLEELRKVTSDTNSSPEEKTKATQKFSDDVNRVSALKQLRQPLGEEAFAELLKQGHDKVKEAMEKAGLKPGETGALDKLKAKLGEERSAALTEKEIGELSLKYKVAKVDNPLQGVEVFGFEVGKATQTELTAQQFLQTGGNEAQIRTKGRLTDEIKQRSGDIEGGKATSGANFDKERERMIAAKQKQLGEGKELSQEDLKEIDEAIEKQKTLRKSLQEEASEDQKTPSRKDDLEEANKKMAEKNEKEMEDLLLELAKNPVLLRKKITARLDDIGKTVKGLDNNIVFFGGSPSYQEQLDAAVKEKTTLEEEAKILKGQLETL